MFFEVTSSWLGDLLVSIITPSYKSERFISQSIESVISQTYQNWEMIVVDDASPDNSNKIIEEYIKKDNRIKFIKLNNHHQQEDLSQLCNLNHQTKEKLPASTGLTTRGLTLTIQKETRHNRAAHMQKGYR